MKKVSSSAGSIRPCHQQIFRFIICLSVVIGIYSSHALAQKKEPSATTTQKATPAFTYKIISAANSTYGYNIYADGKLRIHQSAIPAIPGNDGFKTKEAAEKVATLAITKMKKGESLPTISPDELKKLNAL